MLFVTIRLTFWITAFAISVLLIRKSQLIHKHRWSTVALVAALILTTISTLIPIENGFVTFPSPEAAYNYNHSGSVKLTVAGENADFVVGTERDKYVYCIVPKTSGGWKLGMGLDTKRVAQTISDGITVDVYQYRNTTDYFVAILDMNGGFSKLADSYNSEFKYLESPNSALNKTFYIYYAYVNALDDQYVLTVNGKTIRIWE